MNQPHLEEDKSNKCVVLGHKFFMKESVNDNILNKHTRKVSILALLLVMFISLCFQAIGQTTEKEKKVSIPTINELLLRPVKLKPEVKNVHPRLFFTTADLPKMRERAKGADRELWRETLKEIESFGTNVPNVNDEDLYKSGLAERKKGSMTQYSLAFRISQLSFAYVIEGDQKYLDLAKKLTLAACEMPIWGYKTNKPNVDLPPAHLLYAVAFSYDTLFDKLTNQEKTIIRNKLVKQGNLMYEYFKYKPNKKYTYSQNHTWIPMAGLAIAGYAVMDENDDAKEWIKLSRAVFRPDDADVWHGWLFLREFSLLRFCVSLDDPLFRRAFGGDGRKSLSADAR